ncbi:MAG TPA: energy transducer TonB, partial [Chitinophagaceae bacterium]|nr:energy transducer TonB [Chitinophagaceae bacterium]
AGTYTVIIQFVVDVDGSVSNIVPLSDKGYGLEQEAIRVLKQSKKWKPAIQNGRQVKAYRKQPITFVIDES